MDFDGRLLADASPGPGERIVVAPIDVTALGHERAIRQGHHMAAHLRTEAYPAYRGSVFPPATAGAATDMSFEANVERIQGAKRKL